MDARALQALCFEGARLMTDHMLMSCEDDRSKLLREFKTYLKELQEEKEKLSRSNQHRGQIIKKIASKYSRLRREVVDFVAKGDIRVFSAAKNNVENINMNVDDYEISESGEENERSGGSVSVTQCTKGSAEVSPNLNSKSNNISSSSSSSSNNNNNNNNFNRNNMSDNIATSTRPTIVLEDSDEDVEEVRETEPRRRPLQLKEQILQSTINNNSNNNNSSTSISNKSNNTNSSSNINDTNTNSSINSISSNSNSNSNSNMSKGRWDLKRSHTIGAGISDDRRNRFASTSTSNEIGFDEDLLPPWKRRGVDFEDSLSRDFENRETSGLAKGVGGGGGGESKSGDISRRAVGTANKPVAKSIDVVRSREQREALPGHMCQECKKFYETAVAQGMIQAGELMECLKSCSRHKAAYSPAQTPEGAWDLSIQTPAEWKS